MELLEEIREHFTTVRYSARKIKSIQGDYPAFSIRNSEGYGVAIPYQYEEKVAEKFSNAKLGTKYISMGEKTSKYLVLSCTLDSLRHEFAAICAQFVDPGRNGENRCELLKDPISWWNQWKLLLGNTISEKAPYSVLAELIVLKKLFEKDKTIEWTATRYGSHDIENDFESYEIKSTLNKYGTTVTITGQHQLRSEKRLSLYFCRLEESSLGISIDDIEEQLIMLGYDKEKIEVQLFRLGYEAGSSIRKKKYKVLEKRIYYVDDDFPRITKESFKDNKIPESIIRISYIVDLEGLKYIEG